MNIIRPVLLKQLAEVIVPIEGESSFNYATDMEQLGAITFREAWELRSGLSYHWHAGAWLEWEDWMKIKALKAMEQEVRTVVRYLANGV